MLTEDGLCVLEQLDYAGVILRLDHLELADYSAENPALVQQKVNDLAYVIYTSGTTGQPKGCLQSHAHVVRLFRATEADFQFGPEDVWTLFHSYAFDFSVWEIWGALLYGGRLVVVPSLTRQSPEAFYQLLQEQQVTVLNQTPSAFQQWMALDHQPQALALRWVIFGGEALDISRLQGWFERHGDRQPHLVNMYGITETTVHVTYHPLRQDMPGHASIIGKPLADLQAWVVDEDGQPLPIGIPGELYVAGAGVAQGYLNRAELTAEKFAQIELLGHSLRVYKSGDLVRWRADGNLEYLGRIDQQVKIRGYRIETGEIEQTLLRHQAIEAAVVLARQLADADAELVAFIVTRSSVSASALRQWLGQHLPTFMLPSAFIALDALPLTTNGKIDRNALLQAPLDGHGALPVSDQYRAPTSATEAQLATIWQELLSIDPIGIDDNFFALGGHSLKAVKLVGAIQQRMGIEVTLRDLFSLPSIAALAHWIDSSRPADAAPIPTLATQPYYAVSPAQKRLWILDRIDSTALLYKVPVALRIDGHLDQESLWQALRLLIERHTSLRTRFEILEGEPQQAFIDTDTVLQACTQRELPQATEAQLAEAVRQMLRLPFDLARGPLLRIQLFRLAEQRHLLLFDMHHSISDGWSLTVLFRELGQLYNALRAGAIASLPPLRIQYKDYAAWQNARLQGPTLQRHQDYWLGQLAGDLPTLSLPTDHPRPRVQRMEGRVVHFELEEALCEAARSHSRSHGISLFVLLQTALLILLHKYSGQDDLIIGTVTAGRDHPDTEDQIGCYVNTLALRNQLQPEASCARLLRQVAQTTLDAFEHQAYPFDRLVDALQWRRDPSRSPLFDVFFVLHTIEGALVELDGLQISEYALDSEVAKFDLTLSIEVHPQRIVCLWEYATALFEHGTIERLATHYQQLLAQLLAHPDTPLRDLSILTPQEAQCLRQWNASATALPPALSQVLPPQALSPQSLPPVRPVIDVFEAHAAATPERVAVQFEQSALTYGQINRQANQLAHHLIALGRPRRIAIFAERSPAVLIALLASFKVGAAYIPLSTDYPEARLRDCLNESEVSLILTQHGLTARLPLADLQQACRLLLLDEPDWEDAATTDPDLPRHGDDLAYILYTSGSTGRPKGVMVEQHAFAMHCHAMCQQYRITSDDRVLQFSAFAFDTSLEQMWVAWLSGACSVLIRTPLIGAQEMVDLLAAQRVSVADFPPAYWNQLLALDELADALHHLRLLILGGETLPVAVAQRTRQIFPDLEVWNAYGPTEGVITASLYPLPTPLPDGLSSIPIGKPRAHSEMHILDAHQQPQPPGIYGELYIAGEILARGYLKRPEATASHFVELVLDGHKRRLYRSGDLARWRADGNLELLGRLDHQVKLRGFRIELGEIETLLMEHPAVEEAVVQLATLEGHAQLLAYVTSHQPSLEIPALRRWLAERLPHYMQPGHISVLAAFARTANGKIDRKRLPKPVMTPTAHAAQRPGNRIEQFIAAAWQAVLQHDRSGIHDNFFESGGDSLLAIQLHQRLQAQYPALAVIDLFTYPTIHSMADYLAQTQAHEDQGYATQAHENRGHDTNAAVEAAAQRQQRRHARLARHRTRNTEQKS